MTTSTVVAVIGASGFVGSAAVQALEATGSSVKRVRSPRLSGMTPALGISFLDSEPADLSDLARRLDGVDVVVNAAGNPDAASTDTAALVAANGILPGLVAAACLRVGVRRLVHVSSAAVQGWLPTLDDTDTVDPGSDYSRSKVLGEQMVQKYSEGTAVTYRPSSVHGIDRRVTRMVARIASGPLASVARPGTAHSPQALISNVADAIAFLATTPLSPPPVVIHPWEGLTTTDVMELLGDRRPVQVPRTLARAVVGALRLTGRIAPLLAGTARRVDMLWFGQTQAVSWLSTVGWRAPAGRSEWAELGRAIRVVARTQSTQGRTR